MQRTLSAFPSFVGHIVNGYRIEQLLAQGQASTAYRARHITLQTVVTFTFVLLPETLSQGAFATFMARFASHAAHVATLSHVHLLPVLGYGEYCGYPYLVTASIEGTSLASHLRRQGRYTPISALPVLRQIASALDYAHQQGCIHGNLRPSTLLLQPDQQLRLAGLELVSLLEARGIIESKEPYPHLRNMMGTYLSDPAYLAPECIQGSPADARSDLYALGLLLFELLSGTPPFLGTTYLDIALQHLQGPMPSFASRCPELNLPSAYDRLLGQALASAPHLRFERASELVEAYERILEPPMQIIPSAVTAALHSPTHPSGHSLVPANAEVAQRGGNENALTPPLTASGAATSTALLSAYDPDIQNRLLLQQIEEHIWNGYDLPDTPQTDSALSVPLGPLFSSGQERLRLSIGSVLALALLVVVLVIGSIGLGAWGIGQFQPHLVPQVQPAPGQPAHPQMPKPPQMPQPVTPQAQPINERQGSPVLMLVFSTGFAAHEENNRTDGKPGAQA